MYEVIILILKCVLIAFFALFLGKKTGLFDLGRIASIIILAVLLVLCTAELYAAFFRPDISLMIIFRSSLLNFTLDLSFFFRIFLITLILGLFCSVLGVKMYAKIDSVRELCMLALLVALSILLAVYGTVRVGSGIKISFKFIPVFFAAALFGPFWGGMVGALADVIAFFISPVGGAFIPQITMVEFLYGFSYGLFFYRTGMGGYKSMIKIILCVIFQISVLNLALTSYFLMPIMNMKYEALVIMRTPSALINMAIQLLGISFMSKYMSTFRKMIK